MLAIDHIVIAAKDPAEAAQAFGKKHGVETLVGGHHTNWGTYNYLAYFSNDCYIEWLGVFDQSLATQSDNPLIQQLVQAFDADYEGVLQFALRTDKMDSYLEYFHKMDITFNGPISGNRQKPDGKTLSWRMLFPELDAYVAPFLIEWGLEKNMPHDARFMNRQRLTSIDWGISEDIAKTYYRIDVVGDAIQLHNGLLVLRDKEGITFEVES